MGEIISSQIDYLIFVLVCVSALLALTIWLRLSRRAGRTLIVTWSALPLVLVPGWFLVNAAGENERDRLRRRIEGLAPTYAEELRSMGHVNVTPDTSPDDPLYLRMIEKQVKWLKINRGIADIYTFRQHPEGNQLIVDSETDYDGNGVYTGEREGRTEIGEIWKENNDAINRAYRGIAAFGDKIYTDRWGTWVSAYVPMLDEHDHLEAVLGVDFPADDWLKAISRARLHAIGFLSVIFTIGSASVSVISVLGASLAERKRAAHDLLAAKNAAEAATRSKSEFLANMSHEIRTPMNGVIGMTDLLSGTRLSDQQREYLRIAKQSAHSLLGLLNDILDFSKIEAGKLELESIRFGLRDAIERTIQTLTFRASEKGLEICCRIDPTVPDGLIGDPGRLSQVLVNLAGNAIKFTERGEVVINVEPESQSEDRVKLRFSVRDTGIGIAEDKLGSIFAAFSQEDASTTRRFGGTGLGLAISSQLTRLMGGKIWVQSKKEVGTTFVFTACFRLAADPAPKWQTVESLQGMPVLVIDDNETNRYILDEVLKVWQLQPVLAESGAEALGELKLAVTHGRPYQLALVDHMMPEMDGFEFAEIVKSDPDLRACQMIMISSAASSEDNERCRQLGIARYMTKPVVQSELLRTILEIMTDQAVEKDQPRPPGEDDPGEFPQSLRILLAEDGMVNQIVAKELLKKHRHRVTVAKNGLEAVTACKSDGFDLILMDVQMPEMDGLEATAAIRQHEQGSRHTPIIAMTASAMKGDREKCLECGMDDYISKPIEAADLYQMIAQYASSKNRQSRSEDPQVDTASPPNCVGGAIDQSDATADRQGEPLTIIDLQTAQKTIPGGMAGVQQMAPVLEQECRDMIRLIREGLAEGDAGKVQRGAHTIKGAASIFSARAAVEAALQLERIAEQSRLDEASSALETLQELTARLQNDLHAIMLSPSGEDKGDGGECQEV